MVPLVTGQSPATARTTEDLPVAERPVSMSALPLPTSQLKLLTMHSPAGVTIVASLKTMCGAAVGR
jgi:hypothetical protein